MGVMEDKTKSDHKHNGQISITKQGSSKLQQWFHFLHLIQQITPDFEGKNMVKYVQNTFHTNLRISSNVYFHVTKS